MGISQKALPTVLIVDDSATTRAVIRRVIGMTELEVGAILEASDGGQGLKRLEEGRVDVVLADLNMPGMDGFEMIARMRGDERWRSVPVIVISAQPDPRRIEQLKQQGVEAYLAKPFTAEKLRDVLVPALIGAAEGSDTGEQEAESFNLSLAEALASALEIMAFMSPELAKPGEADEQSGNWRVARVEFSGQGTRGSLSLAAPTEMVADMLAIAGLSESGAAEDALKELANVTCGMFLRVRPEGGAGFKISPPHVTSPTEAGLRELRRGRDSVTLRADGRLVTAQVRTDSAFYDT
ncbi:MAG TPA: response regulator [Phycisphaerae bacterium]|nr:response regulator [Phycisphaerae bacterium]